VLVSTLAGEYLVAEDEEGEGGGHGKDEHQSQTKLSRSV
jgi:hypothetical protein